MGRWMLGMADRAQIAAGLRVGLSDRQIGELIGRDHTVVWRERRRNATRTRGYRPVTADVRAAERRRRPQARVIDSDPVLSARVRADLRRPRTPRQIAGRLRLQARDPTVGLMTGSVPAQGRVVSHEAIYRWIYAHPAKTLREEGILLRSTRTQRRRRRPVGERTGGRIIGMVSIDARPDTAWDRRVPGAWEGDLIVGRAGKSAVATLVERSSKFLIIRALPQGKKADAIADELNDRPRQTLGFLTPREVFTRQLTDAATVASTD